jgi:hypothetical protein
MNSPSSLQHVITQSALGYITTVGFFVGVWALFFPASFYLAFPGCGFTWISIDGLYNEHLIRDVGALNLSIGVLAAFGLVGRDLVKPLVVGVATIAYNLPHGVYHFSKFGMYELIDQVGHVITQGLALASSLWLIFAAGRASRT